MGDRPNDGGQGGEAGLFPFSLHYGVVRPNGSVVCRGFGFNCLTIPVTKGPDEPKMLKFAAPGEKSKLHDPALTKLADVLNSSVQAAAGSRGGVNGVRILLLDEGLCLTWDTEDPELQNKTPDEVNQILRQAIPIMHLTAKERKEIFDV